MIPTSLVVEVTEIPTSFDQPTTKQPTKTLTMMRMRMMRRPTTKIVGPRPTRGVGPKLPGFDINIDIDIRNMRRPVSGGAGNGGGDGGASPTPGASPINNFPSGSSKSGGKGYYNRVGSGNGNIGSNNGNDGIYGGKGYGTNGGKGYGTNGGKGYGTNGGKGYGTNGGKGYGTNGGKGYDTSTTTGKLANGNGNNYDGSADGTGSGMIITVGQPSTTTAASTPKRMMMRRTPNNM
jgi:hypothetical protein